MKRAYIVVGLITLNTLLLFAAVNLVAAAILPTGERASAHASKSWLIEKYGFDLLKKNYPGWDDKDLRVLLTETSNWLFEYEPYTQFRQRPRYDTYITIHPAGFRASPNRNPWPPNDSGKNVFVFGGSTTMGAGVPDKSTIPVQLQAYMNRMCTGVVHVYNFGRGFYYSTQERILFEKLALAGFVPDLAIFIDGLNDFYYPTDAPEFTKRFNDFMEDQNRGLVPRSAAREDFGQAVSSLLAALPAYRLWLRAGWSLIPSGAAAEFHASATYDDESKTVIQRWRTNQRITRAVAAAFNTRVLFVWQPVPTYGYDLDNMTLKIAGKLDFGNHARSGSGYRQVAKLYAEGSLGDDFLWLADMQSGEKRNLYVDAVHYDEAFSGKIAGAISERLMRQRLVRCSP